MVVWKGMEGFTGLHVPDLAVMPRRTPGELPLRRPTNSPSNCRAAHSKLEDTHSPSRHGNASQHIKILMKFLLITSAQRREMSSVVGVRWPPCQKIRQKEWSVGGSASAGRGYEQLLEIGQNGVQTRAGRVRGSSARECEWCRRATFIAAGRRHGRPSELALDHRRRPGRGNVPGA